MSMIDMCAESVHAFCSVCDKWVMICETHFSREQEKIVFVIAILKNVCIIKSHSL